MGSRYTAEDYTAAARALLPRGRVWSDDPDSVQMRVLSGLALSFQRSDEAANDLLVNSRPGSNVDLLEEWEASLGLPDPCGGPDQTVQQRQAQVLARFIGGGGQNRQRFIDFAATLGFAITIVNYAPFRCGASGAGDPVGGEAWNDVWGVTILSNAYGIANDVLLCELNTIKPAETMIIFSGGDFTAEEGGNAFVSEGGDTFILEH
jgi:uncharacterized protein YmfQ (DUF2313 family)